MNTATLDDLKIRLYAIDWPGYFCPFPPSPPYSELWSGIMQVGIDKSVVLNR